MKTKQINIFANNGRIERYELTGEGNFVYFSGQFCKNNTALSEIIDKASLSYVDYFLHTDIYLFAINDIFHIHRTWYAIKKKLHTFKIVKMVFNA